MKIGPNIILILIYTLLCCTLILQKLTPDVLVEGALVGEAVEYEDDDDEGELCDDEGVAKGIPGEADEVVAHHAAEG